MSAPGAAEHNRGAADARAASVSFSAVRRTTTALSLQIHERPMGASMSSVIAFCSESPRFRRFRPKFASGTNWRGRNITALI
jgi:hypothetical protein